LKIFCKSFCSL